LKLNDMTTKNKNDDGIVSEELGAALERIRSLALVLTAATRRTDAQWELNIEAVGIMGDIIFEETQKLGAIIDQYLDA
ncbi:MAG: hypothetical protein ACPF9Q_01810, partial [Opitutales bacterium]